MAHRGAQSGRRVTEVSRGGQSANQLRLSIGAATNTDRLFFPLTRNELTFGLQHMVGRERTALAPGERSHPP